MPRVAWVDPFYLSWKARSAGFEARFIELAGHVNSHMPHHVAGLVATALNQRKRSIRGSKILILGVAYKADIDDVRESPGLDLIEILEKEGARVEFADPHVPYILVDGEKRAPRRLSPSVLRGADCTVIVTRHRAFDFAMVARHARTIVDCRNALAGRKRSGLVRL